MTVEEALEGANELLEARLERLKSLRRGRGLLRSEGPPGFPFELFDVSNWDEFKALAVEALELCSPSNSITAAIYAFNLTGELHDADLTERRVAAAKAMGVSTRTVRRLEEDGLHEVNEWMFRLFSPSAILDEFHRVRRILKFVLNSRHILVANEPSLEAAIEHLENVNIGKISSPRQDDREAKETQAKVMEQLRRDFPEFSD